MGNNTLKRLKKDGCCILCVGLLFTDRKTPCNAFSRNLVNDTVQKVSCACETRTVTQKRSKVSRQSTHKTQRGSYKRAFGLRKRNKQKKGKKPSPS